MDVAAALLKEMKDVGGSAWFEHCETEFCWPRGIRQGGVEAPVLWIVESRKDKEDQRMEYHARRRR